MTRLRVMHLASGDLWAGAEVALFHLASALAAKPAIGIEVVLLNEGELAARLRDGGIVVHVVDEQALSFASLLFRVTALARAFRPHILHTHRAKEHLIGGLAAASVRGAVSLRTVHGGAENLGGQQSSGHSLAMRALNRLSATLQRCAVAVSRPLAGELASTLPGMDVRVIPNGVNPAVIRRAASAAGPHARTGRIGICFSGRLVPVKRVDVFLAAARALVDLHPGKYAFYVVGDGPLRQDLEALSVQLGLGADCQFTGFVADSLPLLGSMGALVLTSDHEGTPMVALEALVLGVPVVAHAVGGLVPLLRADRQGRLIDTQDPLAIARGILSVAPPDRLPPAGREDLLPAEYSIAACAAAHEALYRELSRQPA